MSYRIRLPNIEAAIERRSAACDDPYDMDLLAGYIDALEAALYVRLGKVAADEVLSTAAACAEADATDDNTAGDDDEAAGWFCPGCGAGPFDDGHGVRDHVANCDRVDGAGNPVDDGG